MHPDSQVYKPFLEPCYPLLACILATIGLYLSSLIINIIIKTHQKRDRPEENKFLIIKIKLQMIGLSLPVSLCLGYAIHFFYVSADSYNSLYPVLFDYSYQVAVCQILTVIIVILLIISILRSLWLGNYANNVPVRQISYFETQSNEGEPPVLPPEEEEAPFPNPQFPIPDMEGAEIPDEQAQGNLEQAEVFGNAIEANNLGEEAGEAPDLGGEVGEAPNLDGEAGEAPNLGGEVGEAPNLGGEAGEAPILAGEAGERPNLGGEAANLGGAAHEAPNLGRAANLGGNVEDRPEIRGGVPEIVIENVEEEPEDND